VVAAVEEEEVVVAEVAEAVVDGLRINAQ